jgi:hypothetical protein
MKFLLNDIFIKNLHLLFEGCNLIFIKFLNENKEKIKKIFPKLKKSDGTTLITQIKKFQKGDMEYFERQEFILNVVTIMSKYFLLTEENFCQLLNQNLSKDYLFQNFDCWWYQSLYFMKEANYIRNIHDYCKKYLQNYNDIFTQDEIHTSLKISYNINSVPLIFTKDDITILNLMNGIKS